MSWLTVHNILWTIQHCISAVGVLIIFIGILLALAQFLHYFFTGQLLTSDSNINLIRLNLGRILVLGLEFIVAADLIGTTTTPDYYSLGILAIIVIIRTVLSYTLNRELMSLSKDQ
jgi:uncharacterized membrane protein